jgi:outer membrane lipoprotein-sorting protein
VHIPVTNISGIFSAGDVNDKYLNFTLVKNNNKINIFFDNQTLNLIGWQTEDIYQNLVITFIYRVKLNQKIDQNIFKLPKMN